MKKSRQKPSCPDIAGVWHRAYGRLSAAIENTTYCCRWQWAQWRRYARSKEGLITLLLSLQLVALGTLSLQMALTTGCNSL